MPTLSAQSEPAAAILEAAPGASITAIVPARDEQAAIAGCVRSLARQAEIAQIFVVNDESSDGTVEIVRGLMQEIRNLRLLEAGAIPAGWLGKNNAVGEGAKRAASEWLLFTDADAEL
jgi:cellulose synthase/poly-beta-1,6-N-acetylglucosamine synthase-like glycosyltransferase